jgi:glucose/arabinose dehydrogenase
VVLDPAFETNHTVFITFNEGTKQQNHLAVFRAKFDGASLSGGKVIFRSSPEKAGPQHSGGRMVFLPDGTFLVTVSDGFTYRYAAQDLDSDLGKVLRLDRDGHVPRDNPFVGKEGARPEIFTYGHRNALGLLVDPRNGDIWLHENGPKGDDEINLLKPGLNYGWPKTTFGVDLLGRVGFETAKSAGYHRPCCCVDALDCAVGVHTLSWGKISAMDRGFFCGRASGEIDSPGKDSEWELDRATDTAPGIGYAYSRRADGARWKHLCADRQG